MKFLVLLKMVPDVVEELSLASDGKGLDADYLRMILGERDEHALEQALLLKERFGGTVTALALDAPEVDDALFTALAKGAERAVKVAGVEPGLSTRATARAVADVLTNGPGLMPADLILTGVQAIDDLDGQTAALLAHQLGLPYLGIVTQVAVDAARGIATVVKEYAGGVRGEFEVTLPAVLGIQSAEKWPRYITVSKVMAASKTKKIETVSASGELEAPWVEVIRLAKPEVTGHAEILEGTPEQIAAQVYSILAERSLV